MGLTQPNLTHAHAPLYNIMEVYDLTNLKPTSMGSANQNPLSMIWITIVNQTLQTKLT